MSSAEDNIHEIARKRQRNRLAQQKYRKKLKSHIADLEKRAAVADRLPKANVLGVRPDPLTNDNMFPPYPFVTQTAMGGVAPIHALATLPMGSSQTMEPSAWNNEPSFSSAASATDFAFAEDPPWSNHKGMIFHEMGSMEMHQGTGKTVESRPSTRQESRENTNPPIPLPTFAKSATQMPSPQSASSSGNSELESLESRVDYIVQAMQAVKFETPDAFMSSYYTSDFKGRSTIKATQEASRMKGLPQVLEDLRANAGTWSVMESYGYRDKILRSAADLIVDEFHGLAKKNYVCEIELQNDLSRIAQLPTGGEGGPALRKLQSAAAELKKTLRDELPNLYALMASLFVEPSDNLGSDKMHLFTSTIRLIAASNNDTLQEAADWVYIRANPGEAEDPGDESVEDFEQSSSRGAQR